MRKIWAFLLVFMLITASNPLLTAQGDSGGPFYSYLPSLEFPFTSPVFKWAYGGCYSSWCETGWYSSPAVAYDSTNHRTEVVASAYSLVALNGTDGSLYWRSGSTNNRTWPGVVVADINKDAQPEIVIAQSGGLVSAYRTDGTLIWQKQPSGTSGELRGLLVADLDGDNSGMEVVVTRAQGSAKNTWVLDSSGNTRPGWPQLPLDNNNTNGYGWGVYNANAAAANMSGDGRLELVVPSDVHYINAYEPDGSPLLANPADYPGKYWGQVGVWESLVPEKRGWGACDGTRTESYRTNFADGPATITDVNQDGKQEVIVTGNTYDCHHGYPPSRYMAVYIFNPDRSRFNDGVYDWTTIPTNTGAPLRENYNVIESAEPNPTAADLDGDGKKEILYASYDGRLHVFWLDKTEHGVWPFAATRSGDGYISFASEPAVADLDNDGKAEVIFATWTQKGSHKFGKLYILNWLGQVLSVMDLPAPRSSSITWNGAMAAPTLADINGDGDLEVVLNTAYSGVVVYTLPHTGHARILWGTGRGSYTRAGATP